MISATFTGSSTGLRRRTLLQAAAGAAVLAAPPIISARGEEPVKIGFIDPLTGVLAGLAQTEVQGAKYATEQINKNGGILGRQVQLLVEDSANDVGTGVEKALKLINRDKVNVICADVNSAIAYAVSQVTNEHKIYHLVAGGHTDPITGIKLQVERVPHLQHHQHGRQRGLRRADQAVRQALVFHHAGLCVRPHLAGWVHQEPEEGRRASMPATCCRSTASDFSASLIKAKAYKPNVLLNNMGGLAQINCMKQFVQFGMDK